MTPMLSGHFSIFGLVFLVLKSLLGIATQWSLVKFAFMTLKLRSRVFFKYIKLGLFPTDTAPYVRFSGNQALQSHYMNISQGRDGGCLPYTKSFQKIQLESKWNMTFQVISIKKTSVSNRTSEKVMSFCSKCSKQKFVFHFNEVTFDTTCLEGFRRNFLGENGFDLCKW